jgi:thiamine-phosphate pyrophosphorylase
MSADMSRCRLCLIAPPIGDPDESARAVGQALSGGDVASVIITAGGNARLLQEMAEAIVPLSQALGVAAILHNDTRIAGRTGADGVHVDSGVDDLIDVIEALAPKKIVGAGGLRSRHDAMTAGEAGPDYVFFGRLDGDTAATIFDKTYDLAAWWSSIMVVPAVVMGGSSVKSVRDAASAGIEFVALRRAVWEHPRGPRAAVSEACELLAETVESAA